MLKSDTKDSLDTKIPTPEAASPDERPAIDTADIASPAHGSALHHGLRNNKQILWLFVIVVILLAGMGALVLSLQKNQEIRSRAAVTGPTLALAPATLAGTVGQTYAVGVTMNTNADTVSAAELHLTYDPTAIQIVSFSAGSGLTVPLAAEAHAGGNISVTLGAVPTSPFKGAGIIGTWQVKILAAKNSSISFTSGTQAASVGKTSNSLVSSSGTTITVAGAPATTPTPTPRGSSTPTPTPHSGSTPTPHGTPTPTPRHGTTPTPTPNHSVTPTPTPRHGTTPTPTPTVQTTYVVPTSTPTPMPNGAATPTPTTYQQPTATPTPVTYGNTYYPTATPTPVSPTATPTPYTQVAYVPPDVQTQTTQQTNGINPDVTLTPTPTPLPTFAPLPPSVTAPQATKPPNFFVRFIDAILAFFKKLFGK